MQGNKKKYLEDCNDLNGECDDMLGLLCQETDGSKKCR